MPAVPLSRLLNQLDERNELGVLRQQALESEEELVQLLHLREAVGLLALLSSDSGLRGRRIALDLVEGEYDYFDDELADAHLELALFELGDLLVDQNAVDEVIQNAFSEHKPGNVDIVVHGLRFVAFHAKVRAL